MSLISRKEVSRIFGVTPQTIASWSDKGILKVAYKTPTGRCYYEDFEVEKVRKRGFEQNGDSTDTGI